MNYHLIHNVSVGVAFIGTVLLVLEVLREMQVLQFPLPANLDLTGFVLVVIGSILAAWTAKKIDNSDNQS